MGVDTATNTEAPSRVQDRQKLMDQYGCGPVRFAGTGNALYERHLLFDKVLDRGCSHPARSI